LVSSRKQAELSMATSDIILALIAVLFPPIAVWIKRGICSVDSLLNILLLLLGYLPGLLHAWYIIAKYPDDPDYALIPADVERQSEGRVTYYYVSSDGQRIATGSRQQHGAEGYGTAGAARPAGQASALAPAPAHAGEGSSGGAVPPSYADAVKGDNKTQT